MRGIVQISVSICCILLLGQAVAPAAPVVTMQSNYAGGYWSLYVATIISNTGSFNPTGSGAAAPFTFLDWSVFDSTSGDDNDLNDFPESGGGPFPASAPYRIARILASNDGAGTIQVKAFDTLSSGQATIYNFTYGNPDNFGDFNHDGFVDAADYIVWRKSNGTPSGYNSWRANFGTVLPGAGRSIAYSAVPEPSTALMLTSLVAGVLVRRRRKPWSPDCN